MRKIKGPVFPVITPFIGDGHLDLNGLKKYVKFLLEKEAKNIYVTAYTSRLNLLTTDEIKKVNEVCAETIKEEKSDAVFIAGAPLHGGINSVIDVAQHANQKGADYVSVIFTERYYSDKQVVTFFKRIASSIACRLLIHEEPLNSVHGAKRIDWPIGLLYKLFQIPNITAIKEDSNNPSFTSAIAEMLDSLEKETSIIISGNSKQQMMNHVKDEIDAYLVGLGSVYPEISIEFWKIYQKMLYRNCWKMITDWEIPFFHATKPKWHTHLKAALYLKGLMNIEERLPLIPLNSMELENLDREINRTGRMFSIFLFENGAYPQ